MYHFTMRNVFVEIDEDTLREALRRYMAIASVMQHPKVYVEPSYTECIITVDGEAMTVDIVQFATSRFGNVTCVVLASEVVDENGGTDVACYTVEQNGDGHLVAKQTVGNYYHDRLTNASIVPSGFTVNRTPRA